LTNFLRKTFKSLLTAIASWLDQLGISPDFLTVFGTLGHMFTAWIISQSYLVFGALSLLFLVCVFIASHIFKHPSLLYKAKQYKYLLLLFGLFLALLTFFLGTYPSGNGPRLWLGARGIYFQPSELLKLLLILFLAAYFSDPKINLLKFNKAILPATFPNLFLAHLH